MISLNERLRRLSRSFRLCEDDYETIWLEDGSKSKDRLTRLGTLIDAERFVSKLERNRSRRVHPSTDIR